MKLLELMHRRNELTAKAAELKALLAGTEGELEALNSLLFKRVEALVATFEGGAGYSDLATKDPVSRPWTASSRPVGASTGEGESGGLVMAKRMFRKREVSAGSFPFPSAGSGSDVQPQERTKLGPEIVKILREAGTSLSRNEIFERLVANGVEVSGKDPKANLSAHLSYHPEVERDIDGWKLKEEAW